MVTLKLCAVRTANSKKEKSGRQTFCLLTTRPNGRPLQECNIREILQNGFQIDDLV